MPRLGLYTYIEKSILRHMSLTCWTALSAELRPAHFSLAKENPHENVPPSHCSRPVPCNTMLYPDY
uniref:Uncharacterized protein n=1 Tax=Anguilla anguilla TaxID=7936 RepID=A0A0E9S5H2_ANGAN